jgi:shikimate dehydrogenase
MSAIGKLYGLVGRTLGHSFSRGYFTRKFSEEGINACYLNFEMAAIGELTSLAERYPTLCGVNVTIPYKRDVMALLDEISDEARSIGAVNVVKIDRDDEGVARMTGYNTDCMGFWRSIEPFVLPMQAEGNVQALVLGTGGASLAVCHALATHGVGVTLVSRTEQPGRLTYGQLTPEIMASHRVIVNTTPCGMSPDVNQCPDIDYDCITDRHLCYDLIYNPEVTEFMRRCAEKGATVKNGLEMLELQAEESWRIWNS